MSAPALVLVGGGVGYLLALFVYPWWESRKADPLLGREARWPRNRDKQAGQ